jgi:hypothetical protein
MPSSSVSPLSSEAGGDSSRRAFRSSGTADEMRAGVAKAMEARG